MNMTDVKQELAMIEEKKQGLIDEINKLSDKVNLLVEDDSLAALIGDLMTLAEQFGYVKGVEAVYRMAVDQQASAQTEAEFGSIVDKELDSEGL